MQRRHCITDTWQDFDFCSSNNFIEFSVASIELGLAAKNPLKIQE
jgi:hypothetical protein